MEFTFLSNSNGKHKKGQKHPYKKEAPSKLLIIELLGIISITYLSKIFNLFYYLELIEISKNLNLALMRVLVLIQVGSAKTKTFAKEKT